jgi:hypothetical protein
MVPGRTGMSTLRSGGFAKMRLSVSLGVFTTGHTGGSAGTGRSFPKSTQRLIPPSREDFHLRSGSMPPRMHHLDFAVVPSIWIEGTMAESRQGNGAAPGQEWRGFVGIRVPTGGERPAHGSWRKAGYSHEPAHKPTVRARSVRRLASGYWIPIGSLANAWCTAIDLLANTYTVPIQLLSDTYPTPIQHQAKMQ